MENTTEEKQCFVAREILDKGYNSDKFLEFLKNKKPQGGDNIEKWTYSELEQAVKQFQRENKIENKKQNPFTFTDNQKEKKTSSIHIKSSSYIPIEEEILCLGPDESELQKREDLEIKLSFPEKRKNKKFAVYFLVETFPCNFSVRRSDQDFKWLRKILTKLYPGTFVRIIINIIHRFLL